MISNPLRPVNCIFGGQITHGRDVTFLMDFLALLRTMLTDLRLTIYSPAARDANVQALMAPFGDWVELKAPIPRWTYLKILGDFDVGLVVTDKRANVPTFPSKMVDYLSSGLPVCCIIEACSDVAEVLNNPLAIHFNNFDLSRSSVVAAAEFILDARSIQIRAIAREVYEQYFSVSAARKILLGIHAGT